MKRSKTYITKSANQTRKLGEKLAKEIVSPTTTLNGGERRGRGFNAPPHLLDRCGGAFQKGAIVIAMQGDLGGGKTTFIQGFARGLGIKENITSPTFVILKKFEISKSRFQTFYHIDCYRLEKPEDLMDLGIKKILSDRDNIVAIEWSEKIQKILPKNAIKIKFEFIDNTMRKIKINNNQ